MNWASARVFWVAVFNEWFRSYAGPAVTVIGGLLSVFGVISGLFTVSATLVCLAIAFIRVYERPRVTIEIPSGAHYVAQNRSGSRFWWLYAAVGVILFAVGVAAGWWPVRWPAQPAVPYTGQPSSGIWIGHTPNIPKPDLSGPETTVHIAYPIEAASNVDVGGCWKYRVVKGQFDPSHLDIDSLMFVRSVSLAACHPLFNIPVPAHQPQYLFLSFRVPTAIYKSLLSGNETIYFAAAVSPYNGAQPVLCGILAGAPLYVYTCPESERP